MIKAGLAVCDALLSVPPPETIDHAPVVAAPPTEEPFNVIAEGLALWQTVVPLPALAVAAGSTVTVV